MNRLAQALLAATATASAPPRLAQAAPAPRQVDYDVNLEPPPVEAVILQPEPIVPAEPGPVAAAPLPRAETVKPPPALRPVPTPPPLAVTPEAVGPRPEDRRSVCRLRVGSGSLAPPAPPGCWAWSRKSGDPLDPSRGRA